MTWLFLRPRTFWIRAYANCVTAPITSSTPWLCVGSGFPSLGLMPKPEPEEIVDAHQPRLRRLLFLDVAREGLGEQIEVSRLDQAGAREAALLEPFLCLMKFGRA